MQMFENYLLKNHAADLAPVLDGFDQHFHATPPPISVVQLDRSVMTCYCQSAQNIYTMRSHHRLGGSAGPG